MAVKLRAGPSMQPIGAMPHGMGLLAPLQAPLKSQRAIRDVQHVYTIVASLAAALLSGVYVLCHA